MSGRIERARQAGRDKVGRARKRATVKADDTRLRAATELSAVAGALHHAGNDLSRQSDSMLAPLVERVADQVDRVAGAISRSSMDDLARDVQRFAKKKPALFLGGCFAAGVLAAGFLRKSRNGKGREVASELARAEDEPTEPHDVVGAFGDDFDTH